MSKVPVGKVAEGEISEGKIVLGVPLGEPDITVGTSKLGFLVTDAGFPIS